LDGFSGHSAQGQPTSVLQTDGYAGYNEAVKVYGLIHVGCLTHVRRKFYKLAAETKKKGKAHKGLDFCNQIYGVEKRLREENLSPENFLEQRRQLAIPIWNEFYEWLKQMKRKGIPEQLGIAINYAFNQYPSLIRYLDYPEVTPDNNIAENAIRPFVIGRKNWLFNNTSRDAHSSAILYSLVETAKINSVEPSKYLNFLFSELSKVNSDTDLESLMPWSMVR
jgi:transposase